MTITPTPDRFATYEVFDDHGHSVGRVILPRRTRFIGAEQGTVYLRRELPRATSSARVRPLDPAA
jgi:hypothetical protein